MVEGVYTFAPSPAEGSTASRRSRPLVRLGQSRSLHLPGLRPRQPGADGIANAKEATGTAIKDNIRKVTQGGGKAVDNAVDGIKAIAAGEKVDYAGASGPCDFDDKGDILDCKFRYDQIKAGKERFHSGEDRLS